MEKYINFLKTMWNDEKGKALIKLFIYLIFIIIAILYTKSLYRTTEEHKPTKKTDEVIEEYLSRKKFTESITVDGTLYSLEYGDKVFLSRDENEYEIDALNSKVTLDEKDVSTDFEISFWNLTPQMISKMINDRKEFYVTNFSDATKEKGYKIPLDEFITDFDGTSRNYEENSKDLSIMLVVHQIDKKIDKVSLDMTAYYQNKTNNIKEYKIEIKY